ncbi:UV-stimulated scaffold protein A isoform X3 [Nannospalax galili]|uniref:UV-stimulated scaffold protein A isoform X3 n=1 Tax=Nannospalax galili TaxID=1026970 RepID=UPI000819EEE4|nr:UV-stimulated scaffold protein A isoform X3 [Nannospalax galili]
MDQKLSELIEELTTSGEPRLNAQKMKELKKTCKSSEEQLNYAYRLLTTQLTQDHAEIRLSAFQIMDELFTRSHHFRMLLVSDFQKFLELTLGTDNDHPLPPPWEAAQRLKQAAMQAVEGWNEKFGEAYKKLALGYHFLKHTKKVDFQDVNARTVAERKREEVKQRHLDKMHRASAERAEKEMEEMADEMGCCLTEVENCFRLLVPLDFGPFPETKFLGKAPGTTEACAPCFLSPDLVALRGSGPPVLQDEEQPCCSKDLAASVCSVGPVAGLEVLAPTATQDLSGDESEDGDPEEFLRSHGLGSHKYTLDLELSSDGPKVQENEDNLAVLHAARDSLKLIRNKFLPAVCSWVQTEALEDSEDENEDFMEVPEKEGYEPHIPDHLRAEYGLEPKAPLKIPEKDTVVCSLEARRRQRRSEEASDPTSAAAQLLWLQDHLPPTSSSTRVSLEPREDQKLVAERARAPVVPFGVDLCYWGQEQMTAGKILKSDSQHRFWKPCEVEEEVDSAHVSEMLHSRHITFAGKFEPVQHQCRAPRHDGRLCQRQDRLKCPFHGKIIPRDDRGQPLNPEDRAREQRQQLQQHQTRPDWQDPEFMKDVEAATGVDLGSSRYRGKGKAKRRKHPNLTDLRERANTSRARLEKKVFAKAAVQRVVAAMNQMDQKKHEKFANQFNYALN